MSSDLLTTPDATRTPPRPGEIRLRHVTKVYDREPRGVRLRSLVPMLHEDPVVPHTALDGFDLHVHPGESVGMIGPNGAGKSTVLKLAAGVTHPTAGAVERSGDVAAMIELGLGFHPDLTGAENARCSLVMHGGRGREVAAALEEITEFSGLGRAMDAPLKNYSMGMRARLAFSVATHTRREILVIDEILAVGDRDFQDRCIDRVRDMVAQGSSLLFVSHEMSLVSAMCDRVLHLREGAVVDDGPATDVVERYVTTSSSQYRSAEHPAASIESFSIEPDMDPFDPIHAEMMVAVERPLREPAIGIDMSLPTIAPNVTSASSTVRLPAISRPGRYRLVGRSTPIGFENAEIRLTARLVDRIEVADTAIDHTRLSGTVPGLRPQVSMTPEITIRENSEHVARVIDHRATNLDTDDWMVRVDHATKCYPEVRRRSHLRAAFPGRLGRERLGPVHALDGASMIVRPGEAVGLIGPNGAGKSTMLKAIAGLLRLDSGTATYRGRLVTMLDLGASLHPDLSGRQNADLSARLVGLSPKDYRDRWKEIMDFSGVEAAIDVPVKQYSSGMKARLAFAIGIATRPDVLLVDELLSVGDEEFRRAALTTLAHHVDAGTSVVFVSHELRLVEQLCSRVLHIDHGHVIDDGPAAAVIDAYGGASWAGGAHDAIGGMRLLPVEVDQRHIPIGGRISLRGGIVVDNPSPSARLELSYRAVPPDRDSPLTLHERELMSVFSRTLIPSGEALTRPGRYDIEVTLDGNEFAGSCDLVLAVIDERENIVLTESWQEIMVGPPRPEGFPGPILDFVWDVTRLGDHDDDDDD